jgi:hypothetical protein
MKEHSMFSEYVVRALVAEHVERLRSDATADRYLRSARSVRSVRVPTPAMPGRLRLRLAHPFTGSARHPQPGAC